jgi:hypothetical protein
MFERFWLWAGKSRWRLRASLFVIGAGNAVAFFWHYHRSPIFAFFDALFAIVFLGASIWSLLSGTDPLPNPILLLVCSAWAFAARVPPQGRGHREAPR